MAFSVMLYIVIGSEAVLEVDGVDWRDGSFAVVGVAVFDIGRKAEGEVVDGVVEGEAVFDVLVVDVRQAILASLW